MPRDKKVPPSLKNIFAELADSYGSLRTNADLSDWADQGVLLLNRSLTVWQASPNSHKRFWDALTRSLVQWISENAENVVFMLWGNDAKAMKSYIDAQKHLILEHSHPSPLSRQRFVGNRHFVRCNDYLKLPMDCAYGRRMKIWFCNLSSLYHTYKIVFT